MRRGAKIADSGTPTDQALIYDQLLSTLQVIGDCLSVSRESLPTNVYTAVMAHLTECQGIVTGLKGTETSVGASHEASAVCDVLHVLQQVITAHDAAFIQHDLTHQLRAAPNPPRICLPPEQFRVVVAELFACAMQLAAKGSCLEVAIREIPMRQGSGLACTVTAVAPGFSERDRYHLFEELASVPQGERGGSGGTRPAKLGFTICRQIVERAGGQLWVENPAQGKVALTVVFPAVREPEASARLARLKCDVVVTNYPALCETYGTAKAALILERIVAIVRGRIRYPIDAVAAFEPRGVVSAILEFPTPAAEVVVKRFREALRREEFHCGRQVVDVTLDYRLIPLP